MFCPRCGKPVQDGAKFCVECGYPTSTSPDPRVVQVIQLRCKNCGGIMTADPDNQIIACKYCGSQELIIENSKVTIERIKSKTARDIREIDYKQHESQKDLELEKLYYDEGREVRREKRGWRALFYCFLVICACWAALIIFAFKLPEKRDIAAGKIPVPSSDESYIGEQYHVVEVELRDAGFTNVISKPLNDIPEESEENGKVYKIIIDGDTDFYARKRYLPDVNIFIYYQSIDEKSDMNNESS